MGILKKIKGNGNILFLIFATFLFFVLRFPSLFEPFWYGDEGVYQAIGIGLNDGKLLYKEIFDNKPPLLYWLYAFYNSDQFIIRFVSIIFGVLSVIVFFLLAKKLFKDSQRKLPYYLTIIFVFLFSLPIFEGNIANAENFMLFPILTAALMIFSTLSDEKNNHSGKYLFYAGIFLGIAFLFKIVAIFDLFAFVFFYFILNFDSYKKRNMALKLIGGFLMPILIVTVLFLVNGTFIDFFKAAFLSNISYVEYGNKIGSFPIWLIIKSGLLGFFSIYLFLKRKSLSKQSLFILLWFAFSLFNAFFSQRPYSHYLLTLISSMTLFIGLIFFAKNYRKNLLIIFLICLFLISKIFHPNIKKNLTYYLNFTTYLLGKKTTEQYHAFFDRNTVTDYELARFLKPKLYKKDNVFVFGNNAQLYKLLNTVPQTKYVVAYHITSYKDGIKTTEIALNSKSPKFIIVTNSENQIPFSLANYSKKIYINKALIYEKTF